MPSSSRPERVWRARPLLGCTVSVDAAGDTGATLAVEAAFAEIGALHHLMSFHEPESDVSRLNRRAACEWVHVDPRTFAVLTCAQFLNVASAGVFDITIAPRLVTSGALPRPHDARAPCPRASAADIELDAANTRVRFHRHLWIDLGGIAKGYAVDRATEMLMRAGVSGGCVNAGGDLRVFGENDEPILLRSPRGATTPVLHLADGALASSAPAADMNVHYGEGGRPAEAFEFVAVAARRCTHADALTKAVLALGAASVALLDSLSARAFVCDAGAWRTLGAPA